MRPNPKEVLNIAIVIAIVLLLLGLFSKNECSPVENYIYSTSDLCTPGYHWSWGKLDCVGITPASLNTYPVGAPPDVVRRR